jgi:cell division protein FtsL
MGEFIGAICGVVVASIGLYLMYTGKCEIKALKAGRELPKLKEMIEKQQKQIDDLKRELEELKKPSSKP